MMHPKRLTLDANILLRAVFGKRVSQLLRSYENLIAFYSPDACFAEAEKYIPSISARRGADPAVAYAVLRGLSEIVQSVDQSLYEEYSAIAKDRISHRDQDDWPIVATALLLKCPVWTEDHDFFGSGLATWTTQTVEHYLRHD